MQTKKGKVKLKKFPKVTPVDSQERLHKSNLNDRVLEEALGEDKG